MFLEMWLILVEIWVVLVERLPHITPSPGWGRAREGPEDKM